MKLAIFDLDHTIINFNSDSGWSDFLVRVGMLDAKDNRIQNTRFQAEYVAGTLNIVESVEYVAKFLSTQPLEKLLTLRTQYVDEDIQPKIRTQAIEKLQWHQAQGHEVVISSATNDFVVAGVMELLNISMDNVVCTKLVMQNNAYTGKILGIPNFKEGKVANLTAWLANKPSIEESWGYSDSYNDKALLEFANHAYAVTPDDKLKAHAQKAGWEVLDWV